MLTLFTSTRHRCCVHDKLMPSSSDDDDDDDDDEDDDEDVVVGDCVAHSVVVLPSSSVASGVVLVDAFRLRSSTCFSWWTIFAVHFLLLLSSSCFTSSLVAMSAPVPTTPKWVNPCGVNPDQVLSENRDDVVIPPLKPPELFSNVALQSKLAKDHADTVIPEFVMDAFKDEKFPTYESFLTYVWLPQIPDPTSEYLQNLQVEDALRSSFEYLQHYAVGLEQMVMDQVLYGGDFLDHFRQMEGKLRQVLCELQLAMLELNVQQNADVEREVMSHEYRDVDSKTARDIRDWIVLRDYIKALNFISVVFNHFKIKSEAS